MPSASDKQRKEWGGEDGIGEDKAANHLANCGWVCTRQWMYVAPFRKIEYDEWDALNFLVCEWDYGYLGQAETDVELINGEWKIKDGRD